MSAPSTRVADARPNELETLDPEALLRHAFRRFSGRAAIGTSLQKTGVAIVDLAARLGVPYRVFFVDTRSNYAETYELLREVETRYAIEVERFAPSDDDLEWLNRTFGQHAHFFNRDLCCRTRKKIPLQRALETLDCWITGLRADQSEHRGQTVRKVEIAQTESGRDILKLNPLADWTSEQVDEYTREHGLPYNRLYDYESQYGERFDVIGCRQCHIPVKPEFGRRAGKFPWEQGKKECGIHERGSGI
jgi:phosphoadenosine phosphosulfate reductase